MRESCEAFPTLNLPLLNAPVLGLSSHLCTQQENPLQAAERRSSHRLTKHPSGEPTKGSGQTLPSQPRCRVPVPPLVGEPRLAEKPARWSPSTPASSPGISSLTPETQTVSVHKSDASSNRAASAQRDKSAVSWLDVYLFLLLARLSALL